MQRSGDDTTVQCHSAWCCAEQVARVSPERRGQKASALHLHLELGTGAVPVLPARRGFHVVCRVRKLCCCDPISVTSCPGSVSVGRKSKWTHAHEPFRCESRWRCPERRPAGYVSWQLLGMAASPALLVALSRLLLVTPSSALAPSLRFHVTWPGSPFCSGNFRLLPLLSSLLPRPGTFRLRGPCLPLCPGDWAGRLHSSCVLRPG